MGKTEKKSSSKPKGAGKKDQNPSAKKTARAAVGSTHEECPFFDTFLDEASDPILIIDKKGNIVFMNKALEDLFGITQEKVGTYDKFMTYCYPDKVEREKAAAESRQDISKKNAPARLREIKRPDGSVKWYYRKINILPDGNIMMIGQDVTNLEKAETQLERTQYALDNSPDAAFWMGADAAFVYVNKRACKSLGYSKKELLGGMTVPDIDPLFQKKIWPSHWKEVKEKKNKNNHRTPAPYRVSQLIAAYYKYIS